jgi:hypothetical protein
MAFLPAARLLTTVLAGMLAAGPALPSQVPASSAAATFPSAATSAGVPDGAAGATDAAGALALARRTGKPVEITGERTETGQVFANPSGTRTLEQYVMPVRARRGDGWVPIDTRLRHNPDGSVSPGATVTGLRLSGGGSGPLVSAAQGDHELSLTWPEPLPAPVLDADTATYPDILPGVDMQVRVDAVGFSEVLVVHDAAAARNPALRRIRFTTQTRGLTLRAGQDGASAAVDPSGAAVFVSGTPMMWESGDADPAAGQLRTRSEAGDSAGTGQSRAPRQRPMRLEVDAGALTVVPDPTLLSAPDVRYPLYIDPSYSAAQYRWTLAAGGSDSGSSYWTDAYYRKDMRVGVTYGTGEGPWRTFFQVNTAPLAHATISQAWVSVSMTHTATCAGSNVELWHTATIDPAKALTWTNSASSWLGGAALDTETGKANKPACGDSPMLMEFGLNNGSVKTVVQDAATGAAGPQEAVAFGLKIPSAHESNQDWWKRFDQSTARLDVVYNTPPLAPTSVSTVPPTPCGTAAAPTPLDTATPVFGAVGYDPNGDLISDDVEISSGATVLDTETSGTVGSGDAVNWLTVPSGVLPTNQPAAVFSYRARTRDATLAGAYSTACYFTVDTTRPVPPAVTSTDYPDGTRVRSVGETGTVKFTRAAGDSDVVSFQYGFTPDATTMSVTAGPDGTATVPVTLWPQAPGDTADVTRTLYARSVDRAGNPSPLTAGWALAAHGRAVTAPKVRDDLSGDRRADFAAVVDQGDKRTTVWNWVAGSGGGFSTGYIAWDSGINGGFDAGRIDSVTGDFNGDGRTDVAMLREDPDSQTRLFLLLSDGTRYNAASQPAWTGSGWRVSHLKMVTGDFNGDGYDDLAELQGLAGGQSKLWVQLSNQGGFGAPVLQWDSGAGKLPLDQASLLAGDFNGDGYTDLAEVYDTGGGVSRLMVHASNHGQFGAPVTQWTSAAGTFSAGRATFVTASVDGDAVNGDEIVALYDDGAATSRLLTLAEHGGGWTLGTWWSSGTGGLDATHVTALRAGDYDGNGHADVAALYDSGAGGRRLYTFASSGTAFADKQDRWDGPVSAALPTLWIDQTRKYRIQPSYDGKCVEVPGAGTADGTAIDQSDCVATAAGQQFRLQPIGASPYLELRTAAGKCAEVRGWSLLDAAPVDQGGCAAGGPAQPNQHFRLDYVSGSGRNILVQIRDVHSDKCLSVNGSSVANGAAILQATCASPATANQLFFVRLEP